MYCFVRFQNGLRSVFDESSQTAWCFCTTSNIYRYILTNSHKPLTNHISEFSGRITLSIGENPMKIRAVFCEFFARRQTDRRSGGLCFIICIDSGSPTFLHSVYMPCPSQSSRFNHLYYINRTVQTMKCLIVEPSPLPILIPLGPKYSPQDPFSNTLSLHQHLYCVQ